MSRVFRLAALVCAAFVTVAVPSAHAEVRFVGSTVQVMVELRGAPLAADSNLKARTKATMERFRLDATLPSSRWYSNALTQYQNQQLTYLKQHGIQLRLGRQFHVLFNGFSAWIPTNEENRLRQMANVSTVVPVHYFHPLLDRSVSLVHAVEAWAQVGGAPNAGKGLMIADIDTGIDINHPCFKDTGFAPSPLGRRADNTADYALTNNKVIVARAFGSDQTVHYTAQDTIGHGTFSAAIEACDYNTPTPLGTKISGVAPAAYLMNYNVFPDGGQSATVLAGLEAALLDGADVANMSLGGDLAAGDPSLDLESQQVDLATKAGLSMVISAGNAGPTGQSISSPGVAPSAIAVGATTNSRGISSSASVTGSIDVPSSLAHMRANEGSHPFTQTVGPAAIVPVGLGRLPNDDTDHLSANDFAGKDLKGKIALIQRGTIFFETKINNAQKAGAVGAIIYDNVQSVSLLTMDVKSATLPAMTISQEDGKALVAYLQTHPDAQLTMNPQLSSAEETPNVLSDFSSRGYSANYGIKPDLVAPGEDIYSATESEVPNSELYNPTGFASANGTSFSAPHVAGAAALVLQKHPKWTPAQVKAVLKETGSSDVILDPAAKTTPSITQMGGGLLNVNAALSATAYAFPDTASLGELNVAGGTVRQSQTETLYDAGGGSGTWNVTVQTLHGSNSGFTLSVPASVTVTSGGHADLAITVNANGEAANVDYDGYIVLTHGAQTLHIPYFVHVVNGPVQEGSVLLVDATTSRFQPPPPAAAIIRKDVSQYYFDALKAIGRPYSYWDEGKLGSPSYNDMKQASAVIYFTGANLSGFAGQNQNPQALDGPLSALDTNALHQYMNAGGRVFVSGEGATLSDPDWSAIVLGAGYASASVYDNDKNDKAHKGGISPPQPSAVPDVRVAIHSNPYVFGNMKAIDFSTKGDGAGTNTAVYSKSIESDLGDSMFGVNGINPVYGNAAPFGNAYGQAALRTSDLSLAQGSADVAMVSSDEASFTHKVSYHGRAVLFSFGFEGINDNTGYATRAQVLQRIFQWFEDKPTATVAAVHYAPHQPVQLQVKLHTGVGVHAVAYVWKIGSHVVKSKRTLTRYTFPAAGSYKLRVQVMDSLGHVAVSALRTVKVG